MQATPSGVQGAVVSDAEPVSSGAARMIGAILVEEGRITESDAERVQQFASEQGLRFGEAAISLALVTRDDVDLALARQFDFPVVARSPASEEIGVAAACDPQNPQLNALRDLRSQLTLRWLGTAQRAVLAITSPDKGDGRSWLAANLATAFAQAGQRTLLIDADLRNPSQHRLFKLDNASGLSSLLSGRISGKDALRQVHPDFRLYVLPAGPVPPNPQELLMRPILEAMLSRFSQMFGVVVVDTTATSLGSDAQIVATRAGSALLLSRRNHTRLAALKAAAQLFAASNVRMVGTVINEH